MSARFVGPRCWESIRIHLPHMSGPVELLGICQPQWEPPYCSGSGFLCLQNGKYDPSWYNIIHLQARLGKWCLYALWRSNISKMVKDRQNHVTSHRKGIVEMDKTKPAWTNNLWVPCFGVTGVRETFTSQVLFSTKLKDVSYQLEFSLLTAGKFRMDLLPTRQVTPAWTLPRSWCIKGPSWSFELACPPTPFPPLAPAPPPQGSPTVKHFCQQHTAWKGCWHQNFSHWLWAKQ